MPNQFDTASMFNALDGKKVKTLYTTSKKGQHQVYIAFESDDSILIQSSKPITILWKDEKRVIRSLTSKHSKTDDNVQS